MTILYGKLHDVAGTPFDQQGTAVVISATQARPAMQGDGLVLVELARMEMEDSGGEFETPYLDPGPVVVMLEGGVSHGMQWEIGIPMEGRWNLASLIGEQVEWEPIVVSRAESAARDSREQADRSESEADRSERAADRVGSAERVLQAESTAIAAETDALAHRDEAKRQADRAEDVAGDAATLAQASAASAGESSASAGDSAASATLADTHRAAAAGSATAAEASRVASNTDRIATGQARTDAQTAATRAETAADAAGSSAQSAESSAESADQTVRDAVDSVTGITDGHRQAAEAAAGRSASSATESKGYRDSAKASAEAAAEVVSSGVADATADIKGKIQLAGDLGGTADNPTVPGLSLAAPGASVQLSPEGEGWSNATGPQASLPTGWTFDGEWLIPPRWLGTVIVTLVWCGRTAAMLRGRRADDSTPTIATVPAGEPETHRFVTVPVDLQEHRALAVAGEWTAEDISAGCSASLLVQKIPGHTHQQADITGLQGSLDLKADKTDPRLSDSRTPKTHRHVITDSTGLRDELDAIHAKILAKGSTHRWDGQGTWTPPDWTGPNDTVINMDTGEFHSVQEVS